ncbi:hypothetical protein K504DRAFT_477201 [Pleomassaria siparia CBS 279.74]|uniref:Fe2OG dioxygenase domain-containing protein n=1 Tax=Pleomassaria siparia CBS 279.74 TaxID=1314801 RepID=A0A6G1K8F8_9PLEO|nr:hypothetical protein K504DRAFT_477201 [Pleomassaria siparia CBS 279.74]
MSEIVEQSIAAEADALKAFRIARLPPDFYYIPNFVSVEEEASILQKIPSQRWVTLSHRRLQAHPSTLTENNNTLLGSPLPLYLVKPVVERFKDLGIFRDTPHAEPNHVLINEYRKGEGIMPHEDGSAYAHVVATVSLGTSICLDVGRKMTAEGGSSDGRPSQTETIEATHSSDLSPYSLLLPTRILQEPRSLLITTGTAYTDLLHGIASVEVDEHLNRDTVANWDLLGDAKAVEEKGGTLDRETRVSLTYRDVLKVSSAAGKVLGALGRR